MSARRLAVTDGSEDFVRLSRCSACHKTFLDGPYNFCPMCGTSLAPKLDESVRLHRQPKWEVIAAARGLSEEAIATLRDRMFKRNEETAAYLCYQIEHRPVVTASDKESWARSESSLTHWRADEAERFARRLELLHAYKRTAKIFFADWEYRVAVYRVHPRSYRPAEGAKPIAVLWHRRKHKS